MIYPRQLNAINISKVLGPSPLKAEIPVIKRRLKRYLLDRGPYSHDFFRKNVFALVSRQKPLRQLVEECNIHGQPIGREPNVGLLQHTAVQFRGKVYRAFPVRPAIKNIKDGLIARVFCPLYTVAGEEFTFEVFQTSLTLDFSSEQFAFAASLYGETLLKDDYAPGRIRIWDYSWLPGKVGRRSDEHVYSRKDCVSKAEIDRVLTLYAQAYDELISEGLPKEVFTPSSTFEDGQYDFWRSR